MGILFVVIAAVSWGCSSVFFQIFNGMYSVNVVWFNSVRIIIAGVILIIMAFASQKKNMFTIFHNPKDVIVLIIYASSIILLQITFYYTISISNAGTATMIQYTCPIMILLYTCIRHLKMPKARETLAVFAAIIGVVSIVTHGNPTQLSIPLNVLLWGLSSAVAMSLYTLIPQNLLTKYNDMSITGWAMFIAGIECVIFLRPDKLAPSNVDAKMIIFLVGIAILSSVAPFITFNKGVDRIGAVKASVICTLEPFTSTILSMIAGTRMTIWDGIGLISIMTAVSLTALKSKEKG
ncbi:MAG: DMT family transporter [Lachnospira sp.]